MIDKLKQCTIQNNETEDENLKDQLIRYISKRSDKYGNKLIEFMNLYHLINLPSATVEQLQEYIATHLQQQENTKY